MSRQGPNDNNRTHMLLGRIPQEYVRARQSELVLCKSEQRHQVPARDDGFNVGMRGLSRCVTYIVSPEFHSPEPVLWFIPEGDPLLWRVCVGAHAWR